MNDYLLTQCAVFCRVREPLGVLSNMHPDHPLQCGALQIGSSEALYQALRFPDAPQTQQCILQAKTPMAAKHAAYEPARLALTRADWLQGARLQAMRLALCMKLWSYPDSFLGVVAEVDGRTIVERSSRDAFWGAMPVFQADAPCTVLRGENQLGHLWMEILLCWQQQGDAALLLTAQRCAAGFFLLGNPMEDWLLTLEKPAFRQQALFV